MANFIIAAILAVALGAAVRHIYKAKKSGAVCGSCSGCCSSCNGCSGKNV